MSSSFYSNLTLARPTRTRQRLNKLSEMGFMLYLGKARAKLTKDGDLPAYETVKNSLYRKRRADEKRYVDEKINVRELFPACVSLENELHMSVNYLFFVIKTEYRIIYEEITCHPTNNGYNFSK